MGSPPLKNMFGWRWPMALGLFLCAMIGLSSGVALTERPDVVTASTLVRAYYSLGLFVVGGLDIGVPTGGPFTGRVLLWIAFFGSPLLAASAVLEALLIVISRERWQLSRIRNHIVVVGSGELTTSYLRVLRQHSPNIPVVVVDLTIDKVREQELAETFDVTVIIGDVTHEFMLQKLRLHRAHRVMLLGDDDFVAFEAASKILRLYPRLESKVVLHGGSLRFLRAMQETQIARQVVQFNSYNLAAMGLVSSTLIDHFERTPNQDTVVIAGFGLFGQTILEELQNKAGSQIDLVAIIDNEAYRRMQIVDEQQKSKTYYERLVYQGDTSHPEVWRKLTEDIDLSRGEPVVIMGTGDPANNLRTALWIKQKYDNTLVFVRTNDTSEFAQAVGEEHGVHCISITQLVEDNIPLVWLD
ncbi:MAG: potassium transporter TrkA [Gammaproteobacteria bacterium]|nr:potassium transporter TrkA [Gammaproteobacteria bacterium]MBT4492504.1 potassium transporter TrkA [Gammaproteobacteria bacterium]